MSPPQRSNGQPPFPSHAVSELCFLLAVSEEYSLADLIFSWNDITASKPSLGQQYHMDKRLFLSHVTPF